ncbi:helix-turn-helix transcriptional regulator [Chryseobacterium culicis]|uniref:AraC-type DNA-binding protein n=1 Tax=Chryseobacterium culicis TaxID=680127 RepID=A0A1H6H337_CHRCI|nr:helix-turn-helix transcriptional regulator [Chryseobacterium culicis]SEH29682.1 AraC-type DNA-binding protein [Chryseobacterium culicis]
MKNEIQPIVTDDLLQYIIANGGISDADGSVLIPDKLGSGYMKRIELFSEMRMMLQEYTLTKPVKIIRSQLEVNRELVVFSFRNIFPASHHPDSLRSSVQISSSDLALEIDVFPHVHSSNIIIGVTVDYLSSWMENEVQREFFSNLKHQSYFYEEFISTKIRDIAQDVFLKDKKAPFNLLFFKIKAEELLYEFLKSFFRRIPITNYILNATDAKSLFSIRNEMALCLDQPPQLTLLAKQHHMSVSKLVKLFRQVFGDSIYNYFQTLRMQEAARLLREEQLSVSEAGYQLGFSNLSHFSRIFEKHIGMKPKKYSLSS